VSDRAARREVLSSVQHQPYRHLTNRAEHSHRPANESGSWDDASLQDTCNTSSRPTGLSHRLSLPAAISSIQTNTAWKRCTDSGYGGRSQARQWLRNGFGTLCPADDRHAGRPMALPPNGELRPPFRLVGSCPTLSETCSTAAGSLHWHIPHGHHRSRPPCAARPGGRRANRQCGGVTLNRMKASITS
jgi:hypothetical protein